MENIMAALKRFFVFILLQQVSTVTCWISHGINKRSASTPLFANNKNDIAETLPASSLIEKAKQLDNGIATTGMGSYSPSAWSNRLGTALTPVSNGVYTADRPFIWNKIDVGGRMTVIELEDALWVHSPVGVDKPLQDALKRLKKPVGHVVSPNYEHVTYVGQWALSYYPDAEYWGCPGLMERKPEIPWTGEIPFGARPNTNAIWPEIQAIHIDTEINPFTGKPFFNEVLFYHEPSKTLLTTDFYWNYPQPNGIPNSHLQQQNSAWELAPSVKSIPWGSRLWKFGMDDIYKPFYFKLMTQEKEKLKSEILKYLLDEWDIETLVPCHGDILRGKDLIRKVLKEFCE